LRNRAVVGCGCGALCPLPPLTSMRAHFGLKTPIENQKEPTRLRLLGWHHLPLPQQPELHSLRYCAVGDGYIYWGVGPQGARSAFSSCHSQSEPIFPVNNSPAGENPRRQIAAFYTKQSHFTPPRSVTSRSRARGFPKVPAPAPPVCIVRSPTLFNFVSAG
jgi:hypothetical protein